jgi:hypothetical protein
MLPSSPATASTDSFFYEVTTAEQRAQAATHLQHALHERLPQLTQQDWLVILDDHAPTLRIKEEGRVVTVAEGFLSHLTSWAIYYHAVRYEFPDEGEPDPKQLGNDVYYLAHHIQAYAKQAKWLLTADPELVSPLSVDQMRSIMHRLAGGNTVAERCAETRLPRIAEPK